MIRLSMLKNCPVICRNEKIGLLQSICIDEAQKQVYAFIVSGGFRGKKTILSDHILSIADGFILVDKTVRFRRQLNAHPCPLVRDTTGMLAGRITDYAIDENTLRICAIEIIPGYLPFEFRRKIWVFEYSKSSNTNSELVIPAGLGCEPIGQWKEKD